MAEKTYYWIKLQMDFFKSPAVRLLRRMSGGDTYAVIYLEMILLSLENGGYIYFTGIGKDFSEELGLILEEQQVDVEFLLTFLNAKHLIEYSDEDASAFRFADDVTEGLVGKESSSAKRVRAYRKRQKALQSNSDVTGRNVEKEKELELDLEQESEQEKESGADQTAQRADLPAPSVSLENEFDLIWNQYPNKKGKKQAFAHYKIWRKQSIKHTNDYLLERLRLYQQDLAANKWKQPMNGSTWFNGRFDDDYQAPSANRHANGFALEDRDVADDDLPW